MTMLSFLFHDNVACANSEADFLVEVCVNLWFHGSKIMLAK